MYQRTFAEIDDYIDEHRYVRHSSVSDIVTRKIDILRLRDWAIQKYHQTYMQNVAFGAIHSNAMEYHDIRQFQVEQLIGEETDLQDGSDSHFNLMQRFAIACGASDDEVNNSPVGIPVHNFVNYLVNLCKNYHPVLGMLAIYCNERQTPESANRLAEALEKNYGFSKSELEWFHLHGGLDTEHADHAKQLILKYSKDVEDFESKAWGVVIRGIEEWTKLQDYYAFVISGQSCGCSKNCDSCAANKQDILNEE